jgi:3',5'-nucleoside bisphosphate phosphatase
MRHVMRLAVVAMWLFAAAPAPAQSRQEVRFPDLPGYKTLKCDLHMHTVFSDGLVWPTVRVDEAWREGLDAIAITDHLESQYRRSEVSGGRNRSYELAAGSARQKDILLIRGVEVTRDTPPGHFNVLFLKDVDPLDVKDFYGVFEQAALQNAFVMWNHPGWKGPDLGHWGEAQTRLFEQRRLHAIEVCNGRSYYPEAHRYALDRKLTMLGNSDIHDPASDRPRTAQEHRTLTLVFAKDRTLAAIREALDAGRTAVWFQNQLIGREEQLAPLFAACVDVHPVHQRSGDSAWFEVTNHCELDIVLQRTGSDSPLRIDLPALGTSLARIDVRRGGLPQKLSFEAANFLVSPGKPLRVSLELAEPESVRSGGARGGSDRAPSAATRPQ